MNAGETDEDARKRYDDLITEVFLRLTERDIEIRFLKDTLREICQYCQTTGNQHMPIEQLAQQALTYRSATEAVS